MQEITDETLAPISLNQTMEVDMVENPKPGFTKFNLASIRLSQDYTVDHAVEKVITHVPIQKTKKGAFFRVHPGLDFQLNVATLEVKAENTENYLLTADVLGILPDMEKAVTLRLSLIHI